MELFNVLAALGRRLPSASHIQGIVTHGGEATNIVPALAEGRFGLRAATTGALDDLAGHLATSAEGVALATGTTVTVERAGVRYEHFRDSGPLSERFAAHLDRAGIRLGPPADGVYLGSSDIGNLSQAVPVIHPYLQIADRDTPGHSEQMREAAARPEAHDRTALMAVALARTALDVLGDPEFLTSVRKEFRSE